MHLSISTANDLNERLGHIQYEEKLWKSREKVNDTKDSQDNHINDLCRKGQQKEAMK
jgi:hypothetical protein